MKKLVWLSVLFLCLVTNVSYGANWTRSGNISHKKWNEKGPVVFGVLGNPPQNNNNCSGSENPPDHALTFDISILARNAGDAFDVNKIYVNGAGAGGEAALIFWLAEWFAHTGSSTLPPLIVGNNWSGVNTISICVGGLTYGAFPGKIKSVFLWYDGPVSTTKLPFPKKKPAGTPMDMSDEADALAVSGNGNTVASFDGPGAKNTPTEAPTPSLPNFIANRSWLETVGGTEQYIYAKTDEIKMKGQFKNIGSGEIPNDATIHSRVYLSKGYKEDAHSDWIRVGTDETRGDSLDVGETHTETEGLKLWEYSEIKPGKTYNIVWCVDRTADQNNGSGDWPEEHESDNCSTETVFTVNGNFDFRIDSAVLGGGKTSLAPDEAFTVDIVARNAGDNAPRDTRVGYYLSGGSLPEPVLIGTDAIKEENFTAGVSKAETLTGAVAPTESGTYALLVCADYDNRVQETDEGNNCFSVPVIVTSVVPPPDPSPKKTSPAVLKLLFD